MFKFFIEKLESFFQVRTFQLLDLSNYLFQPHVTGESLVFHLEKLKFGLRNEIYIIYLFGGIFSFWVKW